MKIRFVPSPTSLGPLKTGQGRFVMLDLAFAYGSGFARVTEPFLQQHLEDRRLALYVDHHRHDAWSTYADDSRFLLVERKFAPACPELVTEEVVAGAGEIDRIMAHADFDGAMAAAKWLNRGRPLYPDADEDARAVDSPGRGYRCSLAGQRVATALASAHDRFTLSQYTKLLRAVVDAWCCGRESDSLALTLDDLVEQAHQRSAELQPLLQRATVVQHRGESALCVLQVPSATTLQRSERKMLLRQLEERALIGVLVCANEITCATFDDDLDLTRVSCLGGSQSIAWGHGSTSEVSQALLDLLDALQEDGLG